jgi:hypothetical protein
MLEVALESVRENAKKASTEDLLDRVTVYRNGMEPEALAIIGEELESRGVTADMILKHSQKRAEAMLNSDGTAIRCSFCLKPAIKSSWSWHRLWGVIPIFPRVLNWCENHIQK